MISGESLSSDFKGTFYIVVVLSGKNEIEVHSLKYYEPGSRVGINIAPDSIHIIPYDASINHYEGVVGEYAEGEGLRVSFADFEWFVDPKEIFGEGEIVEGAKVEASFTPDSAEISDDAEAGIVTGNIISFIYVGDHYRYTVRSKSEEDYIVDDEDLWNQDDYLSVNIPKDKMSYRLVGEQ